MKSCPYCGKEYPDDATICLIDQTRLDPDVPVESSRAKTFVDMAARPLAVKFAVGLLSFGEVLDIVRDILMYQSRLHRYANFHYPDSYLLSNVCTYGIMALFFFCIYRGKNWARWVVACLIIFGTIADPLMLIGRFSWNFYFHVLIDLIAVVALFRRASNEWYKGSKIISNQPAPTT